MQPETVLASRRVYDGHILNLRIDDVRTANGIETIREVIEHRGAVALIAFDDQQRLLLVRQYRHAVRRATLEIPAGTLEHGEDPERCAARELREETGFEAERLEHIGGVYPSPGFCTEYIHLYVASGLSESTAQPEADEAIELERLTWDEALERVRAGDIADGKSVSALLLYELYRQRP
jgi:ADP-ribose pyrophosphatase